MANEAEAAAKRARQVQSSVKKERAATPSAPGASNSAGKKSAPQPRNQKTGARAQPKITPIDANTKSLANSTEKDCPNCTAIVAITTTKCKCGYGFPQGADLMDEIGLSDEESANLLSMLQPGNGA